MRTLFALLLLILGAMLYVAATEDPKPPEPEPKPATQPARYEHRP